MITPAEVNRLSSLDFEAHDDLVEIGYQEARRQIYGVKPKTCNRVRQLQLRNALITNTEP